MAIIKCHECGGDVSTEATACPKCGAKPPVKAKPSRLSLILACGIVAIGVVGLWSKVDREDRQREGVTASSVAVVTPVVERIKPESLISFKSGTIACLTQDALFQLTAHAAKGEMTKANAVDGCIFIDASKKLKVLSVKYPDDGGDLGLLEIVGADSSMSDGAWAYTAGAEEVH